MQKKFVKNISQAGYSWPTVLGMTLLGILIVAAIFYFSKPKDSRQAKFDSLSAPMQKKAPQASPKAAQGGAYISPELHKSRDEHLKMYKNLFEGAEDIFKQTAKAAQEQYGRKK